MKLDATKMKAVIYEQEIGLTVDTESTVTDSELELGKKICHLDIDQITESRVDETKNAFYYDTFESVFYSTKLNSCVSKWKRYWVNDLTLQILYYDALSGQSLNDVNLPEAIEQLKGLFPEEIEKTLQLEKI